MIIIFSDLDGTLLDHITYSFEEALPALELIKKRSIPLILSSSKSRAEIEIYRERMNNNHPFISENGGGIFIPKDYFSDTWLKDIVFSEDNKYYIIQLGISYDILCRTLKEIENELGCKIKGFNEMDLDEIMELTDLPYNEAILAKRREYDEPFIIENGNVDIIAEIIRRKGFNFTKGAKLFHIFGNSDKGKAVEILKELFRRKFGDIITIGAGDGLNDLPLLNSVDYPVLIKKYDGSYEDKISFKNIIKSEDIGPRGWNRIIKDIILKMG
jgi:mannosyl-3-phosphoglycerate phosphatase